MPAVSKVIQLPAPVQTRPAVERWGMANLTISPLAKSAAVTLVAVDAAGQPVPNGDTLAFGISGAQYDAAIGPLATTVITAVAQMLVSSGKAAPGTVVVDAQ